mgnify:CR=1 FL=1
MHQTGRPLQNTRVLVTRPKQRADDLCQLIERAGGIALRFAAIEIGEPADTQSRDYARDHIAEFTMAIFISPTAVEQTLDFLPALPDSTRIAAIGSKTAQVLESRGISIAIRPDGHDSESLLRHPELKPESVSGDNIVIFRGEGGRELLGDRLQSRGATVFYADMYRRSAPADASRLNALLPDSDIITISSNEGLQNLYELARDKEEFTRHWLIVPGERASSLARTLGFDHIIVAKNATDEACMNALEYTKIKMSKIL